MKTTESTLHNMLELGGLMSEIEHAPKITKSEFDDRIKALRCLMHENDIQATILVAGTNMHYFTGLTWSLTERFVGAVITSSETIFICPKFEESALRPQLEVDGEYAFWEEDESPSLLAATFINKKQSSCVAIDPKCPLWLYEKLAVALNVEHFCSATSMIESLRANKSANELALIQRAMNITLETHKLAFNFLKPGLKASEIAHFIDEAHRQFGADNGSYFCAVQFNEGTSHPHGVPGDPQLMDNSIVLIDTGCQISGYHSDITRTFAFGNVSERIKDYWSIEKEAQAAAFSAAGPGIACEEIDLAARKILEKYHLGPNYSVPGLPHRTGHGIGLEIHESPYLVKGDKTILSPGMCFSNEPMIVVPGEFGIRLEDHFYIKDAGAAWFTTPQKSIDMPFT